MPSLLELYNNVSTFNYYTGKGNFTQNSLPYGPDRPGSGYSGEPYIQGVKYSNDATGFTDAALHTTTDLVRVSKFLTSLPKGPLFLAKQVGQQLMNPLMERLVSPTTSNAGNKPTTGQGFIGNIASLASNAVNYVSSATSKLQASIGSNRIFNPLGTNLLAQVGVSAAGIHYARQGFDLKVAKEDTYPYIAKQNDINGANRLSNLLTIFANGKNGAEETKTMFSYIGGANSYLGIGTTKINSYYSTFAASDPSIPASVETLNGFIPIPQSVILQANTTLSNSSLRDVDFRAYKALTIPAYAAQVAAKNIRITDYTKYNTTTRIGVINTNRKSFEFNPHDGVNMVSLYYAASATDPVKDINNVDVSAASIRDMIKFRIKAIDNDSPGKGVYMIFRAFLNNLSDDMDATWNPVRYTGRGESFYGYEGFTSGYTVGFTIAALSKEEMRPLYQKLNYLKSTLTPDYANNKMRGNFVEMTVGDYLKGQPGIITHLDITIPEGAAWEIAMNEPDAVNLDKDMHELPQVLKVQLSFTPIYNFLPRKSSHAPFIGIDDTEEKGNNNSLGGSVAVTASTKEWLSPGVNTDFQKR